MADVRSLLRNELASRKGTSPNTTGNRISKKRKVDNGDGLMRKKLRSTGLEAVQAASDAQNAQSLGAEVTVGDEAVGPIGEQATDLQPSADADPATLTTPKSPGLAPLPSHPIQGAPEAVDEDEWAAFEREVVAPTRVPQAPAAITAEATISAAPVSMEELAAQRQGGETSTTRTREAELENEREDAARFMEEEFDEMDQLEERVRRLKHMREELRQKRVEDQASRDQNMVSDEQRVTAESESDEGEDEDWDDWRFK